MRILVVALAVVTGISGEIVDKIAITVGQQAISELQLDEELRVTAFLNHRAVIRDASSRRAAADRLIQQVLVKREMDVSRYPAPTEEDVNENVQQIRGGFGSAAQFDEALTAHGITEATLRDHLALQLTTLRFIEYRFQPDVDISEAEIAQRYRREIAAWKATHSGTPPSLEASRTSIRNALIEEHVDAALDLWLNEMRKRVNTVYLDKTLQ